MKTYLKPAFPSLNRRQYRIAMRIARQVSVQGNVAWAQAALPAFERMCNEAVVHMPAHFIAAYIGTRMILADL